MFKTKIIWGLSILLLLAGSACDRNKNESGPAGSGSSKSEGQGQSLSIKGSDTMVHLSSTWAERFMAEHAATQLSVTGGGSGTGIAALLNGTTDICAASRMVQEKEKALAAQHGINLVEHIVARDGIAVIVNPANPVNELSLARLRGIFTGELKGWQEVGGGDEPFLVLSRESSSGTYVFFQEHVLNKADYTPAARLLPGTSALVQAVTVDKGAIAYVGLGFAEQATETVKALKIKASEDGVAVVPSEESVRSGEYPIARPLYLYTNGTPSGATKEFIDFCLSPAGQQIVRETGYVPL